MFKARFSRREDGGYDASYGKGGKKLAAVLLQQGNTWRVAEGFALNGVPASKKLGEVKEAWGRLAEASYGTNGEAADAAVTPPAPPKLPGPPSLRRPPSLGHDAPRKGPPSLRIARGQDPNPPSYAPPGVPEMGPTFSDWLEKRVTENPSIQIAEAGVATCPHCKRPFHGWRKEEDGTYKPPCRCDIGNGEDYEPDPFDPRMYESDLDQTVRVLSPIGVLDKVFAWMLRNPEYVQTDGKLDPMWENVRDVLFRTSGYAEYRPERWHAQASQS